MRKAISAGVAVILAVTLAGCSKAPSGNGDDMEENDPSAFTIVTKTLSDGVILECAYIIDRGGRSGFECNWENVTEEREARNG